MLTGRRLLYNITLRNPKLNLQSVVFVHASIAHMCACVALCKTWTYISTQLTCTAGLDRSRLIQFARCALLMITRQSKLGQRNTLQHSMCRIIHIVSGITITTCACSYPKSLTFSLIHHPYCMRINLTTKIAGKGRLSYRRHIYFTFSTT